MCDLISKILNDRYLIIRNIGHGAYSQVYHAYDIKTKVSKAIKVFDEDDEEYANDEFTIINDLVRKKCKGCNITGNNFIVKQLGISCIVTPLYADSLANLIKCNYSNGMPEQMTINILKQLVFSICELDSELSFLFEVHPPTP